MTKLYKTHLPLHSVERAVLTVGAAVGAFMDPRRADLVAATAELTGTPALRAMLARMQRDPTGREILTEKPLIDASFMCRCTEAPPQTFGAQYAAFMQSRKFSPTERPPVRFVDDPELAYVALRYRQVHDFWHVLFDCPTTLLGETALKGLEFVQTGLPMTAAAVAAGNARLTPDKRAVLMSTLLPWALRAGLRSRDLMLVYYEEHVNTDLNTLRSDLGVLPAPRGP